MELRVSGGAAAISSMVSKNVLQCRSFDPCARDLPEEAFGEDGEAVYTLPAAQLRMARLMLASGGLAA